MAGVCLVAWAMAQATEDMPNKLLKPAKDSLQDLGEVTVRQSHAGHGRRTTQSEAFLQGKSLDRKRGLSLGDALQNLPGVSVVHTGATVAKPAIRGLNGNRIVIFNHGVRQEGQQWGSEHAPEVDPYLASKITVIQGASSVRYGSDALGGVVLVEPWPLRDEPGYGGEIHMAAFANNREGDVSATVEGAPLWLRGWSWRLQGTTKRGGDAATPGYTLDNTGLEEFNHSAALGFSGEKKGLEFFYSRFHTRLGIFSGSHIGSVRDLEAAIERGQPSRLTDFSYGIDRPYQDIAHQFAKVHAHLATPLQGKVNFQYALQDNVRREYDHKPLDDALAARNIPELEFEIMTHTGDLSWDFHPRGDYDASLGVNGMGQFNTYAGRPFIPNFMNLNGGAFATLLKHFEKFDVEGGARYDYRFLRTYARENGEVISSAFEFDNPSAMLGGLWRMAGGYTAKLHLSTAFRPPGVNELFSSGLHHGAAAVEFGDPRLKPETAYDATLTLQARQTGWSGELAFYRTYFTDFIYLAPESPPTLTIRGAFPTFRYRQADASMWGANASLRFRLGEFHGAWDYLGQASLLRARNEASGDYLLLMPADRFENGLEWSLAQWRALRELQIAATVRSVLKQTHLPPDNEDYAGAPEGYTLLNLSAGFGFPLGTFNAMSVSLEVTNIFDTAYRDYTNRFRYYADDAGRNLVFRLKLPFEF